MKKQKHNKIHLKIIAASVLMLTLMLGVRTFAWNAQGDPDGDLKAARVLAQNRSGFTHAQYPDGVDFPSFNNYTDNRLPFWAPDERRFFAVRKSDAVQIPSPFDAAQKDYQYLDSIQVKPGDKLRFAAYIHNDADPRHNPDDGSTRSVAEKVRVRADSFDIAPDLGNTAIATAAGTQFTINNFISAANTTPGEVSDSVNVTSQSPVRLKFLETAFDDANVSGVEFVPMVSGVPGKPSTRYPLNQYDFFGKLGAAIGSPVIGSGSYNGSEDYRAKVFFDVEVVPVVSHCENISIFPTSFEVKPGVNAIPFAITNIDPPAFANSQNANFTWTVSPPGAGQIGQTANGRNATLLNPQPGVSVSVAPSDPSENAPGCRKTIPSNYVPPKLECQSISISPRSFDPNGNSPATFNLNVAPANYTGTFIWETNQGIFGSGTSATLNLPSPNVTEVRVRDPLYPNQCSDRITVNVSQTQCENLTLFPTTFIAGSDATFTAHVNPNNFVGQITVRHLRNGQDAEPPKTTQSSDLSAPFRDLRSTDLVTAQATPANNQYACLKQATPEVPPPPPVNPQGKITKTAHVLRSGSGNVLKLGDQVEYQVLFTPQGSSQIPTLVLRDTTVQGNVIRGSDGGTIQMDPSTMQVHVRKAGQGQAVMKACNANPLGQPQPSPCFDAGGSIFSRLIVRNLNYDQIVVVTYRGQLTYTPVNASFCKNASRKFCGEQYTNTATYSFTENGNVPLGQATANVFVPCPYLLTRGLGDVVLRQDLTVGSDTQKCYGVPNIRPPVYIPPPPEVPGIPKTGQQTLNVPRHELCQKSNDDSSSGDTRPDAYKNPLASVSSAVCEVSMTLADVLNPPQIRADVLTNIIRLTRNNYTLSSGDIYNVNSPSLLPNASSSEEYQIYKLSSGDLTIHGSQEIGEGARTYVVEHGNLVITGDLIYKDIPFDLKSLKTVPSIAFIVLDGDIIVDPSVSQLSGIFVTLNGSIKSLNNAPSDKQLKVNGSIYGDIEKLFESRSFTGNARSEDGTISINYDGRLYYNLPPGLQEVLDIKQEDVAR